MVKTITERVDFINSIMTNIISTVMKTVCLVLVISSFVHAGFLESFCAQKCNLGRGGNLCRCNGFHFAGKRTLSENYVNSENNGDLYKQYTLDRKIQTAPQIDVPYFDNSQEQSENRIREMQLAKAFLRWLMSSIEKSQEDNTGALIGYKEEAQIAEP